MNEKLTFAEQTTLNRILNRRNHDLLGFNTSKVDILRDEKADGSTDYVLAIQRPVGGVALSYLLDQAAPISRYNLLYFDQTGRLEQDIGAILADWEGIEKAENTDLLKRHAEIYIGPGIWEKYYLTHHQVLIGALKYGGSREVFPSFRDYLYTPEHAQETFLQEVEWVYKPNRNVKHICDENRMARITHQLSQPWFEPFRVQFEEFGKKYPWDPDTNKWSDEVERPKIPDFIVIGPQMEDFFSKFLATLPIKQKNGLLARLAHQNVFWENEDGINIEPSGQVKTAGGCSIEIKERIDDDTYELRLTGNPTFYRLWDVSWTGQVKVDRSLIGIESLEVVSNTLVSEYDLTPLLWWTKYPDGRRQFHTEKLEDSLIEICRQRPGFLPKFFDQQPLLLNGAVGAIAVAALENMRANWPQKQFGRDMAAAQVPGVVFKVLNEIANGEIIKRAELQFISKGGLFPSGGS